jgi:S-adenosylmethionine-dependent methyltransferase
MEIEEGKTKGIPREEDLAKHYDLLSRDYNKKYHSDTKARLRNQIIFSTLEKLLPEEPKKILDAGGGTGFFSIPCAKKGHEVVILDISEKMLQKAIKNAQKNNVLERVRVVQGTMDQLNFLDCYFDFILCHLAFGYTEPSKTLSEFHRVLVKGGMLSLTVANKDFHIINHGLKGNFSEAKKILQAELFLQSPRDIPLVRTFTRNEIVKLCTAAKFELLHVKGLRIISDYISKLPQETETLERLEMKLSEKEDLSSLGRHLYLICKRSD